MKQEMMGWHQLEHMQIICTMLQTDNHASTSSLNFYRLDALPDAQATVSKHCRQKVIKLMKQSQFTVLNNNNNDNSNNLIV